ncbi:MAG TPA: hypothetical protein VK530_00960 [Candidatus Acidoferrum sp.]|nr:hypothetical protein [Candidatus Acidoferrum sp.]
MLDIAWNEHRFTSVEMESFLANLQLHLAINHVNPFVLLRVHMARPSAVVDL